MILCVLAIIKMNLGFLAKGQHVTESVSVLLFSGEQTAGALCGFAKKEIQFLLI